VNHSAAKTPAKMTTAHRDAEPVLLHHPARNGAFHASSVASKPFDAGRQRPPGTRTRHFAG